MCCFYEMYPAVEIHQYEGDEFKASENCQQSADESGLLQLIF